MEHMICNGNRIDPKKLLSKDEVLEMMREGGETDYALSEIRNEYSKRFCDELVWRYPILVGDALGAALIPVQEGFLSIAYNHMNPEDYEIYDLKNVCLLTADEIAQMSKEWKEYSQGLSLTLDSMWAYQSKQEENP